MTEQLVRAEKTHLLAVDVYASLRAAWLAQFGVSPTRAQLLTVLAQVWLETNAGTMSYGYNLGGIKHVNGDGHDYYSVQTHEVSGGVTRIVVQPFRSYADLNAAASDFLRIVKRDAASSLSRATPDLAEYAHDLKSRSYYTAAEHDYAGALQVRYKQLEASIGEDTSPELPVAIARTQPTPGDDESDQPTPPDDLPEPPDAA